MTPKRPEATCLIRERRSSPFGSGGVAADVLAALAGVGHPADPVHRHRERLVRLRAEGAEAHAAGGEAPQDLGRRLDLVNRKRLAGGPELEHAAQHRQGAVLDVDALAELVVALVRPCRRHCEACRAAPLLSADFPDRELQRGDRRRVPGVALAVEAPGVDAALGQQPRVGGGQRASPRRARAGCGRGGRGRRGRGARAPRGRAPRGRPRRPPRACRRSSGRPGRDRARPPRTPGRRSRTRSSRSPSSTSP